MYLTLQVIVKIYHRWCQFAFSRCWFTFSYCLLSREPDAGLEPGSDLVINLGHAECSQIKAAIHSSSP
jgi:hypothetical protein